ncbi:MAG: TAXI family TRAP transporter solute-binding subunit [Candidatus Binatia bacterium]
MKREFRKICTATLCMLVLGGAMGMVPLAVAESWRFGTSKPGGAWYPIATAIQRLADKQYGDKVTLDIGGGMANALNALSGKIDLGLTFASTVVDAQKGRGPFKGKDASGLRLGAVQYPQMMFWVVWADSDIKHWRDLKGKRVNAMPKRFSAQQLNKQMLKALGMSYKDFSKTLHLGFNDAVSQMKDGHIDAYLGPGERQYAPIIQMAAHKPIRILSFSKKDVRKMKAIQPALVDVILEKKYYNQPKDVRVVQSYQIIVTNKNVSENLVYKVAKLMYGNLDYMRKVNPNFNRVTVKAAAQDLGIKRHPGLTKYLKEVGAL